MIKIHFNIHKHVDYGQALFVSGNFPHIGSWTLEKAIRLNWSEGDNWSGTVEIQRKSLTNNKVLEYKYLIGKWQNPIKNQFQWQQGEINRQLELDMVHNRSQTNDQWNIRKLKIHLITKKHIHQQQSINYSYSIIGNSPSLGNWKIRKILKIQQNIDIKTIRKLSEKINKKELISFLKNQLIFQVYATSVSIPLNQQKFNYYFIRENQKLQIQRHPGRCVNFTQSLNYPHRFAVVYSCENVSIYDEQNFDKPILSKITPEIYLGSYLKNERDLQHLKKLGIQAIYSIQTEEDHQDHGISTFYLELLCRQYEIIFRTIEIQDRNPRDFVEKSMKAVAQIDELIKNGNTTYVYCTAGKYRSPQMVALYLTLKNGINVTDAVKFIKEKHPVANPNESIIKNAVYHINKFKLNFFQAQTTVETIKN